MATKVLFNNPFSAAGRWYKGNLHTHTSNSDGVLSAQQMTYLYQGSGYDFLSITDHGKLTYVGGLSKPDFLVIPGEEIGVGTTEVGTTFHLVAINIGEEIPVKEGNRQENPQKVINLIRAQGGEAILGHPYWSLLSVHDILPLEGYLGLEVYNTTCFYSIAKGHSLVHWDGLLTRGRRLLGFATDDAHWHFNDHRPNDACGAWIMVKATDLSLEEILRAIREGLFYASNGPEIRDLRIQGNEIHVATSPVKAINFVANLDLGERFTALKSDALTNAVYKVRGKEKYVRIECVDAVGRTAWSNPIFFEQ